MLWWEVDEGYALTDGTPLPIETNRGNHAYTGTVYDKVVRWSNRPLRWVLLIQSVDVVRMQFTNQIEW